MEHMHCWACKDHVNASGYNKAPQFMVDPRPKQSKFAPVPTTQTNGKEGGAASFIRKLFT